MNTHRQIHRMIPAVGLCTLAGLAGCVGAPEDGQAPDETTPQVYEDVPLVAEQAFPGRTGKPGKGIILSALGNLEVAFTEIDGYAVIDGDLTIPMDEVTQGAHVPRGAGRASSVLWPGGVIPYAIDSALTSQSRVTSAISHWETYTNLKFTPRTTEASYLYFTSGSGCSADYLGRRSSDKTTIALASSCSTGNTIHEIGHAVGLHHEQSRTDRDSYVTINWSLISSDWTYQYQSFTQQGYSDSLNLGGYDYGSVMHYPAYCPTDSSKTCISVPSGVTIGQRDGLSSMDIDSVQQMYADVLEQSTDPTTWYGGSNSGAGMAITDINGDGKPDAIILHVDNPTGENSGYYRVAWGISQATLANNTATTYRPTSYGSTQSIGGWWGSSTSGAGIAVGDIDGNGRPDLVVVHVDDTSGADRTFYRIGWNVSTSGAVTSWSSPTQISAGFHGSSSAGADVALHDINGNGKLDLVVATVDAASGSDVIYYNVGWDLSTSGVPTSWSSTASLTGPGSSTAELGLDVADMDGNGKADLVVSWVDSASGEDVHYYRVGYDISSSTGAVASGWSGVRSLGARMGEATQGADVAVYDFNGDGSKDLMAFHLDPAGSGNTGYLYAQMSQSDKVYTYKMKHSGYCMDVEWNSVSDGAEIQQWGCSASTAQKFTLSRTSDGYYVIIGKNSGKCVEVNGGTGATGDGALVKLWSCNYNDNQKWSLVSTGDGYYQLKAKHSGKCMDMNNASTTEGNYLLQWTCHGGDNQKFLLTQMTN